MNQKQYYEISKEKDLPMRCPILNYCGRRACTIYHNSDYARFEPGLSMEVALLKDGTLPNDFKVKKIDIQGEPPTWIDGKSFWHFDGMCPEVNLFDSEHSLFPDQACVSAEYDDCFNPPKQRVLKTQHYSECPEFNKYVFELKMGRSPSLRKPRKSIPAKTKAILQKEIKSMCPICTNEDVEHFHIHHIDENPINNELSNLLMLCPNCHSKITKNDISYESVREIKDNLSY
jgi:hypothetical protein